MLNIPRSLMESFRTACSALALIALAGGGARAQGDTIPAPRAVIYPGDIIRAEALQEIPAAQAGGGSFYALNRDEVIGKMSRRTLLPGLPIPLGGLDNPRLVINGAEVRMMYVDGGLTIAATGSALMDGGIGDTVRIRNVDSGVVVTGRVQRDGTVLVSGG